VSYSAYERHQNLRHQRFELQANLRAMLTGHLMHRYDPYAREMTAEHYDQEGMRAVRRRAVEAAAPARQWGIVLGTLGRQLRTKDVHEASRGGGARGMVCPEQHLLCAGHAAFRVSLTGCRRATRAL
jgi:Putative diphthamide synthesis protein